MKRILTSFKRGEGSRAAARARSAARAEPEEDLPSPDDTPETAVVKAINAFCASGGPTSPNPGSEVLYLPTIVDAAESSPTAARAAAARLRKHIDLKHAASKPYLQYNAIMLLRILADNPGPTFTRNLADPKFLACTKTVLREGRDPSVGQLLRETLEYFAVSKPTDEGLRPLRELWTKEKSRGASRTPPPQSHTPPPQAQRQYAPPNRSHSPRILPNMGELVARIAEAQTSASLLSQVLQSTPQLEVPSNDLVKEFADRCKAATRSMVAYISADPPPDEDTLTTLIETNEQLGKALGTWRKAVNQAQRAALEARNGRDEEARIVDVVDVAYLEGAVDPVERRGSGFLEAPGAVAGEPMVMHGGVERKRSEGDLGVPPSPVSPVSPEQPITYRY